MSSELQPNLVALNTIVYREVRRFTRIWPQTLLPPAITMVRPLGTEKLTRSSTVWRLLRSPNDLHTSTKRMAQSGRGVLSAPLTAAPR